MISRARVEFDPSAMGVRIALLRENGASRSLFQWEHPSLRSFDAGDVLGEPSVNDWLHLDEDDARALYEALAGYFGHSGHDTRALRQDYDAERGRVDRLIAHLIGGAK